MLAGHSRREETNRSRDVQLQQGRAGELFTNALADAAARGVTVRLVLDAFGASSPPADLTKRIENAGGKVLWFNQIGPWTVESTNTRTHRKLLGR
jgi:cardiolipin synthase